MTVNLRNIVLDILLEVLENKNYSHIVLSQVLEKHQYLSKQERSFISRLSRGTIERCMEMDRIINTYSKTKVRKMKPEIRNILRMSVYQLKYMDAVPASAVCNEAVKLTNKRSVPQLKGFVNGVLRSIAREEKKVSFRISEKYSMPEWIVEDFTERFGEEKTEEILAAFLNAHDTTIRTNTAVVSPEELRAHLEAEGVTVKPVKELSYAFQISDYDHLSSLKAFQDGEFYIQDLSSMMVAERAGVEANQEVLDVCAAPGGKSLHVAELLKGTGSVRSRDLTEMKVDLIRENIERSNMKNMVAEVWDARKLDEKLMEKEDIVIADLPCSGLGIIGKKPDIKYRITREDQESLQALQREILSTVHQYVKPGGTLVFSTCTICKLENEDNVEWFQEQFKDFTLESMEQILPGKDYMDGFFISVFKRK
ncbi:MAG: 16S rRNA (cytosine(967)-C(5))-methyltransferase RsmB [Lachnospiraceae bacterium]|nr:16S rRNA (cytosine(967)-C(5))-methyltransferase RsmB [Lachnospiraceae bacterium]